MPNLVPVGPPRESFRFLKTVTIPGTYRILFKHGGRFVEIVSPDSVKTPLIAAPKPLTTCFRAGVHVFTVHSVDPAGEKKQKFFANVDGWGFLESALHDLLKSRSIRRVTIKRPP